MRARTPIRIFAILSQLVAKGKVKVDPLARHVAKPAGPTLERVNLMVSILILFLSFLSRRGWRGTEEEMGNCYCHRNEFVLPAASFEL